MMKAVAMSEVVVVFIYFAVINITHHQTKSITHAAPPHVPG